MTDPPVMTLHNADGTVVREVASARSDATATYAWGKGEVFTIPSGDGYELPAMWVLPPDFDRKKTYPVMMSIYGGPDAGTVRNSWASTQANYWAQRGVIWMAVDHRGSGHVTTTASWVAGGRFVMPAGKTSVTVTARVTDNAGKTGSVSRTFGVSPVTNGQLLTPQP